MDFSYVWGERGKWDKSLFNLIEMDRGMFFCFRNCRGKQQFPLFHFKWQKKKKASPLNLQSSHFRHPNFRLPDQLDLTGSYLSPLFTREEAERVHLQISEQQTQHLTHPHGNAEPFQLLLPCTSAPPARRARHFPGILPSDRQNTGIADR